MTNETRETLQRVRNHLRLHYNADKAARDNPGLTAHELGVLTGLRRGMFRAINEIDRVLSDPEA